MVSEALDQEVTRLIPKAFDRKELLRLLRSPIGAFETLDRVSKVMHNRLIRRLSAGFDITPAMVVNALNRADNTPAVASVIKMFLVSFLFKEHMGQITKATRQSTVEDFSARPDEIGAVCRYFLADEQVNGASTHMHFLRGAIAYKRVDIPTAYQQFDLARQIYAGGEPIYHHQQGVLSVRPMPVLQQMIATGPLVSRDLAMASDKMFGDDRPIILVGFDAVYHDRYAARMLETSGGRVNLHFHVANPAGAALISHPDVRYSFETVSTPSPAYYASMRFLHLERLLRHYGRPILSVDADAVVAESPAPLFGASQDHDVVLRMIPNFRAIVPWRHVIAQLLLVQPNDAAAQYLRAFRAQFDGLVMDAGKPTWWIDQAVLASSMHALTLAGKTVRFSDGASGQTSGVHQSKIFD